MRIIATGWHDSSGNFQPYLSLYEQDNTELVLLDYGQEINWKFSGPRMCIGYHGNEGWIPCHDDKLLKRNQLRCMNCSSNNIYSPCVRCRGDHCIAQLSRKEKCIRTPYAVYIALFGMNTTKVGVSSSTRLLKRWVEQGADYGAKIADVDGGLEARRLERKIASQDGVIDAVHRSRKQSSMLSILSPAEAKERILKIVDGIESASIERNPDLVSLSSFYGFEKLPSEPIRLLSGNKGIDGLKLDGKIVGVKGRNMLVERASMVFVIDLKRLLGYTLSELEPADKTRVQSGLEHFA